MKLKKEIIPSIIAKNQSEFSKRLKKVVTNKYQLDVMDGKFVKNTSIMFDFKLPRFKRKVHYEAQLMVKKPIEWIITNGHKVDTIIFHIESYKDKKKIKETINLIKTKGKKVGIAIKPKTDISLVKPYVKDIDMILMMTVNPGKYGGKFIPLSLTKVFLLRKKYPQINIEVDGSINVSNINEASEAGASSFVVGSYLQKSKNPAKAIGELKELI